MNNDTNALKHKINRYSFGKLTDSLLFGVALTDAQMSKASEEIYQYFHKNGGGFIIEDLVLKTRYKKDKDGVETKASSWLETKEGKVLNHIDMANLIHRIKW